eukprot:TRINITY_DN4217_c0_g1_i1.p1 TRINITY_DN4217_c0_g1~~TRINITY_DN4217_c0_g1_i1.p1  ORF type:complete len:210 (+),score=55.03 TRINITY_DN4217_c0_g1_i1:547-1176(+)
MALLRVLDTSKAQPTPARVQATPAPASIHSQALPPLPQLPMSPIQAVVVSQSPTAKTHVKPMTPLWAKPAVSPMLKSPKELMPPPLTPSNKIFTSPKRVLKSPLPTGTPGYEISEYHSSSSDSSDDSEHEKTKEVKKIPSWAKGARLRQALAAQDKVDPDTIFSALSTCNLNDVFKRPRKRLRTSSANWTTDQFTEAEAKAYNKVMGFR